MLLTSTPVVARLKGEPFSATLVWLGVHRPIRLEYPPYWHKPIWDKFRKGLEAAFNSTDSLYERIRTQAIENQ